MMLETLLEDKSISLMDIKPEEITLISALMGLIKSSEKNLTIQWLELYLNHTKQNNQKQTENTIEENNCLFLAMRDLADNFVTYLTNCDVQGYFESILRLGKFFAQTKVPYEKLVLGFHFFEQSYISLLSEHFENTEKSLQILNSLDSLHHNAFAILAREYFKEFNEKPTFAIGNLIHDVKNKLLLCANLPELYEFYENEENNQEDSFKDSLKLAAKGVNDALDLISHTLNYLNLGHETYQLQKTEIDIFDLIKTTTEPYVKSRLKKHNKKIYVNDTLYRGGLFTDELVVTIDGRQIRTVFDNLFNNAINYAENEIHFNIYDTVSDVYCAISDDGIGISEKNKKEIFLPGVQIQKKKIKYSFGLGLSSVKKIIELHDGTIGVKSELGKGSTFYFTLPKI